MLFSIARSCSFRKIAPCLFSTSENRIFTCSVIIYRTFFKKKSKKPSDVNRDKDEEMSLRPLSGIDDPNFSHNLRLSLREPRLLKRGATNFLGEFRKLYNEFDENLSKIGNIDLRNKSNRVDMLYTFNTKDDLYLFNVNTDSSYQLGYSSAELRLSDEKTAIFSGVLNSEIPKDGNAIKAGYATLLSKTQRKSFGRIKIFNWSEYTHLVLKIRGDGRHYLVVLNEDHKYEEVKHSSLCSVLYTRGGPYWQIAKLPFSHFFQMNKGRLFYTQNEENMLNKVIRFGITASGYDGPFKLEIDYVGLEYDVYHKCTSPYEDYHDENPV